MENGKAPNGEGVPTDKVAAALLLLTQALEEARGAKPADKLVTAADRPLGLIPSTFIKWCRSGRIKSFMGPRRRYTAWLSDVEAAMVSRPYTPRSAAEPSDCDAAEAMLASGQLVAGTR